jgi:hypothetical protein
MRIVRVRHVAHERVPFLELIRHYLFPLSVATSVSLYMTYSVPTQKLLTLRRSDNPQDGQGLRDAERCTLPSTPHHPQAPSLDAELDCDVFHLTRRRTSVPRDVHGVDAGRLVLPVIHNAFFVAGKVPSLNDLLEARGAVAPLVRSIIMRRKPGKAKSRGARWDLYNDIKQDWKRRTIAALGSPFVRVQAAHFGYLIIEETLKRDPSNICSAAVKFIEDGLVEAGVIPNDGWDNVLSIRVGWVHRKGREPGVYVIMSDEHVHENQLVAEYEDNLLAL